MLQQWNSEELEMAMLLDEPPFHEYQPILSGGESWRAAGTLAKASRDIDLEGYAWLFVVYRSDPVSTWGQRSVKLTTGGEILREESHCGLWTGGFRSLRYEVLARTVYGNIVGNDSTIKCDLIIDARIQQDPPDSETISRPHTRDGGVSHGNSSFQPSQNEGRYGTDSHMNESAAGRRHTSSSSPSRNRGRSRGGKTVLSFRSDADLHSSSGFMNDSQDHCHSRDTSHEATGYGHVNNGLKTSDDNLRQDEEPSFHELLGHSEPQYRSRKDLYGELRLVPKRKHGAVVSFLIEEGRCRDDWYVEDAYNYSDMFQFFLTEFQRRPAVSELLSRLGFVVGATPPIKEALQPHIAKVIHSFEDMSKVTKHGRYR
ncbi:hypothetical protein FGB62_223g05 [Gracilaria domingensis]|nr:hypothetical protein FGB62_223g05 [Gracilaria domingensis]